MTLAEVSPPHTGEVAAAVVGGTFLAHVWGWLPGVVAVIGGVLAIVWYVLMIWESKTVCDWRDRRKQSKIDKLEARLKSLKGGGDAKPSA